jgi:DNA repair photolyase
MANHLKVLTPNKNKSKFFGVDYFLNLYDGSLETFRYFASSIDELMIFRDEMVSFNQVKYQMFQHGIYNLEPGKIIGIFQNPDIYDSLESIGFILEDLKKYNLGLFLETNSEKLLNDLDLLKNFAETNSLLIGIPIYAYSPIELSFFNQKATMDAQVKTIHKLKEAGLNVGIIFKPLIPRVNDDSDNLKKIIDKAENLSIDFIYPSFTLYFDSYKIKNFYDIIEKERPNLKNYYFDNFGWKYSWESQNLGELKKILVFDSKKSKIKYAMKDIIDLYRDDSYTQLKLF